MRKSIQKKLDKIKLLAKELNDYSVIALVRLEGMPSKELQSLKHKLGDKLKLFITTKNNIIRALNDCNKPGIKGLADSFKGSCCIGLTNEDPFKLSIMLQQNKTPSAAKPGQTAPEDVVVKAGPTQFVPGPIITDLGALGIKTKVESGKLTIIADAVIAREGDIINSLQASIMGRFGLKPMTTGINLIAAYEEGRIYQAKELLIDVELYKSQLGEAHFKALNLAFNASITVAEVIDRLLQSAYLKAINLAFNARVLTKDNADKLLSQGFAEAKALAAKINWEV